MYLLGDIGNTETKIILYNLRFKKIKKIYLKTKDINKNFLSNKLNFLKRENSLKKIIFTSVVPNVYKICKSVLKKKTKLKLIELKELDISNLIRVKVNKKQIGSDRLANALGVANHKLNYIVIDFGTATTFDVIVKKNYLGGIIAPGVKLSLKSLTSRASLIPKVNLKKTKNIIGKNTNNAVRSGFYWGYLGLIDNIIKLIKKQSNKTYKLILTGGYSDLFQKNISTKASIDKELTFNGLIKVIKNIKNEK